MLELERPTLRVVVRPIAVSLATCLAVSLAALGWVGLTGGEDDQVPQAQAPSQEQAPQTQTPPRGQTAPRTETSSQAWTVSSAQPLPPEPPLAPRGLPRFALTVPSARPVAAKVVGHTVRYVFKTDTPARSVKYELTPWLFYFAFGERGRSMVVRLLDDRGRFAWAAGYDGIETRWVRVRPQLAGCGPILDSHRRKFAPLGAVDRLPCPLEEPVNATTTANGATVLR